MIVGITIRGQWRFRIYQISEIIDGLLGIKFRVKKTVCKKASIEIVVKMWSGITSWSNELDSLKAGILGKIKYLIRRLFH